MMNGGGPVIRSIPATRAPQSAHQCATNWGCSCGVKGEPVRPRSITLYCFPDCTVTVDEERRILTTAFYDGTGVHAAPGIDDADVQRAHELGYAGDTWAMSRDHELSHTWLAHTRG